MTKKRLDKRIPVLEPSFREILVCKTKNARPYMEVFIHEPENVFQQNLGTLFGVLEINDDSQDSSYVVNYLISVIKKEFFSNIKRGTIESFEAALHKANLALSKLAEHDHISWIRKINALCAVFEKNNIHLATTGSACALLVRSKSLINISEGGEAEDSNPLKTFQEVVSGRTEDDDKIIVATGEIFDIFSLEEIKRSAIKFSREEFYRFLNTALVNELDRAAVLIADISKKVELETEPAPVRKNQKINAFSQTAFAEKNKRKDSYPKNEEKKDVLMEELKKELEKTKEGFTDEKTGHIYIKDDGIPDKAPSVIKDYSNDFYDKMRDLGKNSLKKIKEKCETKKASPATPVVPMAPQTPLAPAQQEFAEKYQEDNFYDTPVKSKEPKIKIGEKISELRAKIGPAVAKITSALSSFAFYSKIFFINRIYLPLKKLSLAAFSAVSSFIGSLMKKREAKVMPKTDDAADEHDYSQRPEILSSTRQEKRDWFNALSGNSNDYSQSNDISPETENFHQEFPVARKFFPSMEKMSFFPNMEKIKALFSRFSRKEKMYAGLVVAILIIVPYFIAKALDESKTKETPVESAAPAAPAILENDKNVIRVSSIENVSRGDYGKMVSVNGKLFATRSGAVTSLEDGKEYEIASEFQNPDLFFEMDDLNLAFLYKDGKIISLHATSRKYQNNNISVPENAKIASGSSYLTYSYLLDSANDQIYRYPRAEGGFGEKTDWIKDTVDFSGALDMAINENVYVTDGKNIWKFYRGKKQDFTLENTATPISIDQIYTKPDSQNLYVLDKTNSRIIKLATDGQIIAQYYHPEIANTLDFAVDEETQKIYATGGNRVGSFGMELR